MKTSKLKTYFPLLLILAYLLLGVGAVELAISGAGGAFSAMRTMRHFMGGFFLAFSFFKLLDLPRFADAYQTYDLLARRSRGYALAYPFIELALGVGFLSGFAPRSLDWAAVVVMGVSALGVVQTLRQGKRIQCACLGTVLALPMSGITLFEDLLMVAMAATGLMVGVQ